MERNLTPAEAADQLHLKEATLANWRAARCGPPFVEEGGVVTYPASELSEWLQRKTYRRD